MMGKIKRKGITILLFFIGLCTLVCGNVFLLQYNTRLAGAIEGDNTVLTVEKISREVLDNDLVNGYSYVNPISDKIYTIKNQISSNDFVMLNNYTVDQNIITGTLTQNAIVENILVSFGNEGSSLYWLTATAKLNGVAINTAGTITEKVENNTIIKNFNQILDLKTLTDINSEPFASLEGYYEYIFSYRFIDSLGQVSESLTKSVSFYLLDENSYVNVDTENNIVPKMFNTEKIDRENYANNLEQNYFNYNNFNVTDIYNPTSTTNLLFPTYLYDASRYNISYTKTLYGVTSNITSSFQIIEGIGQVNFYLNGNTTAFKTDSITPTTIGSKEYFIYDNLVINDIADYVFTVKYLYKVSDTSFIPATTSITSNVYEASIRDNDVNLSMFGYQMYYSKNNTEDAEFKYITEDTAIITDYTKDNASYINNYDYEHYLETEPLVISENIASTNQAPVFLKSYGSLKYNTSFTTSRSFYYYYATGVKTGTPQTLAYTNNTRFTQNGYYELVIIYDFQKYTYFDSEVLPGSTVIHAQVFAFKIANLPPTVSIKTNTNQTITSGKYTNADYVTATWQAAGVFDVAPTAKVWRQNFDGFNPYTESSLFNGSYDNVNGSIYSEGSQINTSGHYTLQIFYGPSTNTSIIYKFTIDKDAISGFTLTGVEYGTDENENIVYLKDTDFDLTGKNIINTPFTLNWNAKDSGATINAKYSFTSLAEKSSYTPTLITEGDEEWVTNGYETRSTFQNLTYYKTNLVDTNILSANSVLKDASIYAFTLLDQAGNIFTYYVVLDNSKAQILQEPEAVSIYNFVPTQTTITWGTHKAIEVSALSNLPTALTSDTTLFKTHNEQLYLLVPIETVKIYAAGLEESDKLTVEDSSNLSYIENTRIRTYTKDVNFSTSVTFYTGLEETIPEGNTDVTGEKIYNTYVTDVSSINDFTNLSYNNIAMLALKMNLDRSQGYAQTYGTVKGNEDNNYKLLELKRASNRQFLYFNFKNSSDDYAIASLTYSFYPLTFETGSINYPFSSTASLIDMDILSDAELIDAEPYRTLAINTIYSTQYGEEITAPGMYIITRTYVGDISEEETGDTKVKQYTYYLDRYNIIEQLDTTLDSNINLDRSQGYAQTYGTLSGTADDNYMLLELNHASDRQFLYFNFKNSSDDYAIASLTYSFYPFTFEEGSANYPFSSAPSLVDVNILSDAELIDAELYRTLALNTIYSTEYAKDITVSGMYVITRTYVGNINEEETGDTKVKQYTYYMDRYNIIEQQDTLLIGENIKILLGEINGREAVIFSDFLINTTKETILETNLLPVAIQIPQNKYSIYDELLGTYSSGIGSFDLQVTLIRKYRDTTGIYIQETIATLGITDGLILLPALYKDGVYEVVIKDKTGYGTNLTDSNEFIFQFEIKNNKPTGSFYGTPYSTPDGEQDIEIMNVSSTSETNLKFMWTDPEDIYSAKIDAGNIQVTQKLKNSSTQTVIYKIVDGIVTINPYNLTLTQTALGTLVGSNGSIIRYQYGLQIFVEGSPLSQVEATYEVTIQYEGLESHYVYETNNFFTNNISMTIDRTAPEYNLNRLITADAYLIGEEKSIVKDNTSAINTENYAFAITSSFNFLRATGTNSAQDTYLIYYRKYNKYETGEENLQSLVPGDENYSNYNVESTRPRFNTANSAYIIFSYSSGAFLSQVSDAIDGDYYEIIEVDEAGNYTVYTVQVFYFGASMQGKILLTEAEDGEEEEYVTFVRSSTNQTIIDALKMTVNNIVSNDLWYTLQIKNNTTNIVTILEHTPLTNDADFIIQINNLILVTPEIKITGASYEFNLINRINKGFTFTYNTQGKALEPTYEDFDNSFIITLPLETAATTIESFAVYRTINGIFEKTEAYHIYYDMNGLAIDETGISGASYEFEAGEYYFYFIDNFNREYVVPKIFGLEDIAEVYFEGATITENDITYTASDVRIIYQTELYSVSITKNGETYTVPSTYITKNQLTGIEEIWLKDIACLNELVDDYVITITNSAGFPTSYEFTVYTITPTINLTDSLDNDLNSALENRTTKSVYVSYTNTEIAPYTATLILERLDEDNNLTVVNYGGINSEFGYYLTGKYTVTFQNELGKLITKWWRIDETASVIYSVLADINGLQTPLSIANIKYAYNDTLIDQYFTKYIYDVDLNPDRNLTKTILATYGTAETGITTVYNLLGTPTSPYDKTFAVTKVPSSTNFLGTSFEINNYYRGGYIYKTTTNPTIINWNSYYLFEGNYIYVNYYFNGNYVGKIYGNEVVLSDSGIYYFEFNDFAGNTQLFLAENYYRIVLINEVLFSMNNLDPINDMIYNDEVSLKVEQISEYDYRTLSIAATLNGYTITPVKVNDAYIFTEYGLYNIVLTAKVTLAGEAESQTITKNYSFIILNENEAKLSFEYLPQTGYEILSVIKDGVNVTNNFKTLYNANTLTKLFLSKEESGNGNYIVTVKANYQTLKPSQTFSFNVWVNNETPIILSSIKEGSTTTKNIMLSFNKYLIYQQVGESVIKINGEDAITINAETSGINQVTNYEISGDATYIVQLQTAMGNTVLSFKVIKKAPLNSIAVFVIIVASIIVVSLTIIFIRLRTKMRVS